MTNDAVPAPRAPERAAAERPADAVDRFLAVLPAVLVVLALLAVLLWEAADRTSPTVFTDEDEWAQISRAIAATGHAARRGVPIGFKSLYPYLIAPAWWLPTTTAAYTAIKYLNELVMAAAAIPTYLLARTVVPRRAAFLAAAALLCTTAYFYAPSLLPEVLAYPAFALCAWTGVRALSGGGRRWIAAAVATAVLAYLVRGQLIVALPVLALAAAWLWVVGPRGRRLRAGWSVGDHLGAALLLIGVFIVGNAWFGGHSVQWTVVTGNWQNRMWTLGLEAGGALAIGLAVLPAIAGLASLWVPERRADPAWRAFAAYLGSAIVFFSAYTAIKAAYLSTTFATRVEERNLIYLAPLLLVGTAVTLTARRPSLLALLAATGAVAWMTLYYGYQLDYPYLEAPGFGIATMANRSFRWDQQDIRWALAVTVVVSLAVLLVRRSRHRWPGLSTALLVVVVAAVPVWMLAGQITDSRGAAAQARTYVRGLPPTQAGLPLNWIDRATDGQGVTYLGQREPNNALGVWLLEFWNKSLKHVYSLDGTAPNPGPTVTPDLVRPDGTLSNDPGTPYVLEDNGIELIGKVVQSFPAPASLALVKLPSHPWRISQAVYNRTDDGWLVPPPHAPTTTAYGSWASFRRGTGTVRVSLSRLSFNNHEQPNAHVVVKVGPVALNQQRAPVVAHPIAVRRLVLVNGTETTLTFEHVRGPVAVEVTETPTFQPGPNDPRWLGLMAGYSFTPTR